MASLRLERLQARGLQPLDLTVAAGELAFLSGPSGSGKSLLLRAIADLDPHQGEAWIDDTRRSAMPAPAWRRRVGLLPAESHWWTDRVGANFPNTDKGSTHDDSVFDLLGRLGFADDALDWSVSRLSTGERQRLALARLLVNVPEVLLLDEATANLDPAGQKRSEELIEMYRHAHRAAVLWVSHDPIQRQHRGERRWVIVAGRLEAEP